MPEEGYDAVGQCIDPTCCICRKGVPPDHEVRLVTFVADYIERANDDLGPFGPMNQCRMGEAIYHEVCLPTRRRAAKLEDALRGLISMLEDEFADLGFGEPGYPALDHAREVLGDDAE